MYLILLPGIDFERSFPHDIMHLIFLNACPNLVAWWTGNFKNIDTAQDHFRISADRWKRIGQRIVESMELIPASFIRQLPDISTLGHTYLAEGWSFWLLHIAPYALDHTLPVVYYNHLMELASITRRAMSYDLTEEETLTTLQDKCTNWVLDYERYLILFNFNFWKAHLRSEPYAYNLLFSYPDYTINTRRNGHQRAQQRYTQLFTSRLISGIVALHGHTGHS